MCYAFDHGQVYPICSDYLGRALTGEPHQVVHQEFGNQAACESAKAWFKKQGIKRAECIPYE